MAYFRCLGNNGGGNLTDVDIEQIIGKRVQYTSSLADSSILYTSSTISGTDEDIVMYTYTATEDCIIAFGDNSQAVTNTSSNDGYFSIEINGTSVYKKYLTPDTITNLTPDIGKYSLKNNDTINVLFGFDNTHTNCWCKVYTAVAIATQVTSPTEILINTILDNGQVSTSSAYTTAYFSKDITDNTNDIIIRLRTTINGTDYEGYKYLKKEELPTANQTISINIFLHVQVTCTLSRTYIEGHQYSGNYYPIYADIIEIKGGLDTLFE